MNASTIKALTQEVVALLVRGDFEGLCEKNLNGRLSAAELKLALEDYPGVVSMPPDHAFDQIDIYEPHEGGWQLIEFNLWYDDTDSDLTLTARVRQTSEGGEIQIHDIHVL